MKRDNIGMADYEKLVKQEFHPIHRVPYPIPISLFFYNWSRTECCSEQSGFMEDSYIKKQRYRDGVWNSMDGVELLFH